MKLKKTLGCLFVVAGLFFIGASVQKQLFAITCTPGSPIPDTECVPPYAEDLQTQIGTIGGCTPSYIWCVPATGSNCGSVSGYAIAVDGGCYYFSPVASPAPTCTEDVGTTVVELKYYDTDCRYSWGTCQCMYVIGGLDHPPQYVEKCACSES